MFLSEDLLRKASVLLSVPPALKELKETHQDWPQIVGSDVSDQA